MRQITEAVLAQVASFGADVRGEQDPSMAVVGLVVALVVAAIVTAFLFPIGIEQVNNATLGDNASEGAEALWNILDLMMVLGVFVAFVGLAMSAVDRV